MTTVSALRTRPKPPTMRDLITRGLTRERILYAQKYDRPIVWKDSREKWPINMWLAWCPCGESTHQLTWYMAYHRINGHIRREHKWRT